MGFFCKLNLTFQKISISPGRSVRRSPVHDGYALRFIVGAFYQIRNPVYHHQMNTAVLIMVLVQALDNGKQTRLSKRVRSYVRYIWMKRLKNILSILYLQPVIRRSMI